MDFKEKLKVLNPEIRKNIDKTIKSLEKNIEYLYTIATTDEKTGVYNNKFFNTLAEMELEKAKRGKPLSLLIIDLDKFKLINDTYGHLTGDKILEKLANVLKKQTRKYDIISRFGGEEFFVLLPDTNIIKAKKVSDRLRKKIESDPSLKKYNLTISGGISCYKRRDSIKNLIRRADKALFKAKENGRNRVELEIIK